MKRLATSLLLAIALSGCGMTPAYVEADRATYDAIAPEYLVYVVSDESLTPGEKERRARTLVSWQARLEEGEK